MAQLVKNLPAMWETWVWSLGWEGPLEKGMATHSSILAWRIPQTWGHKELDTTELTWKWKSIIGVRLFATPWTIAHQALPSMGFSRQEYWSGLPFPSPGDLPDPGIKPKSPALEADALTSESPGKPSAMKSESESRSVMSDSLWAHGLYSPWNSPGQNTGMGSLSLLQGIFQTQGSNPGLPHCRRILHQLSHKGRQGILEWVAYPFSSRSSLPRNWTDVSSVAGRIFPNWAIREVLRWTKSGC